MLTANESTRQFRPPRRLRGTVSPEVSNWELLALAASGDGSVRDWARTTLDGVVAAADAELANARGCTDCEDTGFYGLADINDPDLLVKLLKRRGENGYEILLSTGEWVPFGETALDVEMIDVETAGDLATVVTAGGQGLLRRWCMPMAFLPPCDDRPMLAAGELHNETDTWFYYGILDESDTAAVLDVVRVNAAGVQRFVDDDWVDDELTGEVTVTQLDAETVTAALPAHQKCEYCTEQATQRIIHAEGMAYIPVCDEHLEKGKEDAERSTPDGSRDPSNINAVRPITADAPLTVSPDPRAEKLRRYWSTGRGAAKIKWGLPSDWRRCYKHLRKYMGLRAKGYCFTGDTEFLTRDGVMTFEEACGTTQFVLTQAKPKFGTYSTPVRRDGYWVQAPIRSFGEQRVLSITLKRGGITKVIRATPEHRWMASPNGRNVRRFDVHQLTTEHLRPGMVLAALTAAPPELRLELPTEAICAGAVFGDGSMMSASTARIELWGLKQELLPLFSPYASSVRPMKLESGVEGQRVLGVPGRWKSAPSLSEMSDQEMVGWLAGYIATDGAVSPCGSITLSSVDRSSLDLVQDICGRLGIVASPIQHQMRKGYLAQEGPLYRTTLYRHSIPDNLLIRSDQRAAAGGTEARQNLRWTVVSVEDHGEVEEVFCATVPETESFALTYEIWSLNCQNLHKRNNGFWTGDRRNRGLISSLPEEPISPEHQLVVSIQGGSWTQQEGTPAMDTDVLPDGIYCEASSDDAVLRTLLAGGFPVAPPDSWFANPGLKGPTPMVVEDSGQVRGHIATWDSIHIGMAGAVRAPKSRSGYAYFQTGTIKTDTGKLVNIGQLTLAGGHASLQADAQSAVQHYDDTNSAVADVSVGEDQYGIWAAGALRPSVTPEQLRTFRASPLSGDWRPINGNLELVAACAVNVPGFPIARARVASGSVQALVAAGAGPLAVIAAAQQTDTAISARLDKLEQMVAALNSAEVAVVEDTAPVEEPPPMTDPVEPEPEPEPAESPAEDAPKTDDTNTTDEVPQVDGEKLPEIDDAQIAAIRDEIAAVRAQQLRDEVGGLTAAVGKGERAGIGGYPINNEKDLRNAIHAFGRARPADRARTKAHIISRAKALGLSRLIPDDWK